MSDRDETEVQAWEPGWDGHASAQRRRLARLTLAEKLQWLEDAQRLAQQLARSARERGQSPQANEPAGDAPED